MWLLERYIRTMFVRVMPLDVEFHCEKQQDCVVIALRGKRKVRSRLHFYCLLYSSQILEFDSGTGLSPLPNTQHYLSPWCNRVVITDTSLLFCEEVKFYSHKILMFLIQKNLQIKEFQTAHIFSVSGSSSFNTGTSFKIITVQYTGYTTVFVYITTPMI